MKTALEAIKEETPKRTRRKDEIVGIGSVVAQIVKAPQQWLRLGAVTLIPNLSI